jgi:hypothetical protein
VTDEPNVPDVLEMFDSIGKSLGIDFGDSAQRSQISREHQARVDSDARALGLLDDLGVTPWAASSLIRLGRRTIEKLEYDLALLDEGDDCPEWARELYDLVSREFDALAHRIARRGRRLAPKTLALRSAVLELTREFEVMTVRQIFYQLVSRGIVPKTENGGYRPVQTQVLKMRREGLLPWAFIADGTRWMRKPISYDSVEDALRATQHSYRRNLWRSQQVRIEIWLEKDALAGVVADATERWDVPLMVSRGTSSATFLHSAAQEARRAWEAAHVETVVYALYDFDAAGERAARSVERGFAEHVPDVPIGFERIAVTREQIDEWQLPTRPAKRSDPEAAKFGAEAVELDAIPPDRLLGLVEDAIVAHVDVDAWRIEQQYEQSEREVLERLVEDAP